MAGRSKCPVDLMIESRDEFADHRAAELAQLFEAAGVVVSELVVIEPQQPQ